MTTNNETPDTGTPDVAALIRILEQSQHLMLGEEPQGRMVTLGDFNKIISTLRTLSAANAAQAARIAELEGQVEDIPVLAKHQPCGCVVCTCEGDRCHGCGAKKCGTHPIGEIPNPVYLPTWQDQLTAAAKAERAKCVGELREVQRKWEKLADESYSGQDLAAGRRFESISHGWRNAAGHLEANGREA